LFLEIEAGGFRCSLERLQPGRTTRWHEHGDARMCAILGGVIAEDRVRHEEFAVGELLYRPSGIRHRNSYGTDAPLVLRIELARERLDLPGTALDSPLSLRSVRGRDLATRAGAELRRPDSLTLLVLEGIGLELLAELARSVERESRRQPRWVEETADRIRDEFARGPSVAELAAAAGVHPAHLAQRFRARYGCSIGEFLRAVRVEFACRELRETTRSLAEIALASGFYDQSHFNVVLKRATGRTPGEYRRSFDDGPLLQLT